MSQKIVMGRVRDRAGVAIRTQDRKPYIEVKDAIVARSGIYEYSYDEIVARGHTPKVKKDWYRELRPASVIVASKDLFDLVPVPNKEHTSEYITPENFHTHTSGIVGGPIQVVPLKDSNEIALQGRLAFFTKDAYDYYMAGNRETSADYESVSELVDNPEEVGYDLVMTEIHFVNNVAITAHGRGGSKVRVQDAMPETNIVDKITGGGSMGIFKKFLGLSESEKPFSAHVKDAVEKARTTDAAGKEAALTGIMGMVDGFTDSPFKQALVSSVRDSFIDPDVVLGAWNKSASLFDGLYARCMDTDTKLIAEVTDAFDKKGADDKGDKKEKEDDDEAKKKKAAESKDSFDAAITAAVKDSNDRIDAIEKKLPDLIAEGVKAALNLKPEHRVVDSTPAASEDGDVSYVFEQ